MNERDRLKHFVSKYPHPHKGFYARPSMGRRGFFQLLGGVTGSFLVRPPSLRAQEIKRGGATTKNTAKNVIFILLEGAPSQTDTFDLRVVNGTTPSSFAPAARNGILWPAGLLPKLGDQLSDIAIVRSVRSWALVHSIAAHWTQIGRSPVAALGKIAPNMGSIVAIEKVDASKILPPFLALIPGNTIGPGYLPAGYGPFEVVPSPQGLADTTNPLGQTRFNTMYNRMMQLDRPLRVNSPYSDDFEDYDSFYESARDLMYNDAVGKVFQFSTADSSRYGGTLFGDACLVAKQVLAAQEGTRYVQIHHGNWDNHDNIYGQTDPAESNLLALSKSLDAGVAELIKDLKAAGIFNETLIVMMGEFGRTTGKLTAQGGRDHYPVQFAAFAGGGIKGGRVIGSTNADGSLIDKPGWSRDRDIRVEDIEATIYSAMGIDWTTVRYDEPSGRGFEYVPFSSEDLYGPIHELWG
ncbi:MAG: DUF1501 domain-containing protein [Acidobacteria bacterium]|nr:DUF1501 domain-containing protein [Acidobacteriota bacterium]